MHPALPTNPSSAPPGNVAGAGGPPAGDFCCASRGARPWAALVGKNLGEGHPGGEAKGGLQEWTGRDPKVSSTPTQARISSRGRIGVPGPQSHCMMSLEGAWGRRTFAGHGKPGPGRQRDPRYHHYCPSVPASHTHTLVPWYPADPCAGHWPH